jgi:hypothetical protein
MTRVARLLTRAVLLLATVALLGLTLWGVLALHYRAPYPWVFAPVFGLSVLAGIVLLWRAVPPVTAALPALGLLAVSLGALFTWWSTIEPRADRAWAAPLARSASVSIDGDRYAITNVRNFRWRAGTGPDTGEAIAEERWETRTYDLSKAAGVDLFFSYWTGPLIAHLLVSVTFDDAAPLTFSIEIRREKDEAYSALAGFFKSYELAIVAADERDIVHLRTNIWREDVRLYRLNVSREKVKALLIAYAAEINALALAPRWYDTLGANCTTVAFRLARQLWPGLRPDWRILAAGRAPDYAYAIGAVRTDIPLQDLKRRAAISAVAQGLKPDDAFSAAIRAGVPAP